ncbi:hypothetical protein ElyMa_004366100 [Elysia marginata]|uniref:Cathepsin propeptide inhibitor domain-containing protein n=1 Tax=Elysia marginata TaxID=1093978 RepID=A0AAV4H4W7_9GAST|nr:hypothetical protein ElyMa_004366100 [Elysia marginata]
MLKLRDLMLLVSVAIMLLLLSHCAQGAPTRDDDIFENKRGQKYDDLSHVRSWLRNNADLLERMRRTHQIDAGFLSRHNAISNYLKAYNAQKQASNPYGPGRRKQRCDDDDNDDDDDDKQEEDNNDDDDDHDHDNNLKI